MAAERFLISPILSRLENGLSYLDRIDTGKLG